MYRVILIDDEKPALDELTYLLSDYDNYEVIGKFTDPIIGLDAIRDLTPDVVFLDISMPSMNGFQVAEAMLKLDDCPVIVFATAYDEYAIKAFEINATDYLLKPVMTDRLKVTMERVCEKLNEQREVQLEPIKDTLDYVRSKYINKIPLWKHNRIRLIATDEIQYCTLTDGETLIYTKEDVYTSSDCLNTVEALLSDRGFFRSHRSFLVRLEAITEVIPWFNNTYVVKVEGLEDEIPISRRKCHQFKELLNIK